MRVPAKAEEYYILVWLDKHDTMVLLKQRRLYMIYNVYVVKDKLAEEAGPPFTAVNNSVAIRQYKQMGIPEALKDEYSLHLIGFYDSKEMTVVPSEIAIPVEVEENE